MMELMLEAERALAVGLNDRAEQLYRQVVAVDPRNAIAIVGLARVALERGDQRGAYVEAQRALLLDPDNPMAAHLQMRMAELMRARGEALPTAAGSAPAGVGADGTTTAGAGDVASRPSTGPSLVDRLFRRRR